MRRLVLVGLLSLAACATARSRADDLYDSGRFLEAAELYDQVAREHPDDVEVKQRRTAARNGALRVQLAYVKKVRAGGHPELAAVQLGKLFQLRDGWEMNTEPAIANALAIEVASTGMWIEDAVASRARSGGPLVAEKTAMQFVELLAHDEMESYRTSIALDVASAGRAACARIAPTAKTPYWAWIANRYCAHFNARAIDALPLPNLRTSLAINGSVAGTAGGEVDRMRKALVDAFRATVWYSPDGEATVRARLAGSIGSTFASNPVTKSVEYTEQVPYSDTETVQESYQEPYDDTEYYTEQVPHTEYRTESYSCGDSTCTRSVPDTVYRSESRTRTVTKYRTAWRSVTRPVTRYRTEYRTYTYSAVERSARHRSQLRVMFGGDMDSLVAGIDQDATESGIDHDASFSPAGLSPERANLTSAEDFVAGEEQRLVADLRVRLDNLYAERYCRATQFSVEDAARCAYLDPSRAPPLARQVLRAQLGEDETLLSTVLVRK